MALDPILHGNQRCRTPAEVIADLRKREAEARLSVWRLDIAGKFLTPEYRNAHKRWTDACEGLGKMGDPEFVQPVVRAA